MRRRVLYVIAWAAATAITIGASWLGIRSVMVATVPGHALPLSAADLRRVVPTTPAVTPSPTPSPLPTTPSPTPSPSDTTPTTASAAPPSPKVSVSTPEVWLSVPDGHGGTAFRRTFHTAGGDVVVQAEKGDVKILSGTPKPGFTVTDSRAAPDNVTVTFTAPHRVSRVSARWANGPYAEVGEVAGFGP